MTEFDSPHPTSGWADESLGRCVREVVEFVDAAGWGQPAQMFALVPTSLLAESEPELLDELGSSSELTPVEQEPLPADMGNGSPELDEFLATTSWPEAVAGCALIQEIVVLPPDAESDLDEVFAPLLADPHAADAAARQAAISHPDRKNARLIAAVLRTGESLCLLQLEPAPGVEAPIELLHYEELAPDLIHALHATLDSYDEH
ncbi:MAG: PPA1309 family protein [Mycobacteriaceae bacterium]